MLGADWTQGHTTLGMVLTHSKGEGSYRLQAQTTDEAERSPTKGSGKVRSTLSGAFPYARHALDERLSVWGSAGYGSGTLTLTPEQATPIETDMDLMMGAVGVRGIALEATSEGRPQIAVTGDAMAVRTRSEAAKGAGGNLAETEADVTRLRVGVQSALERALARRRRACEKPRDRRSPRRRRRRDGARARCGSDARVEACAERAERGDQCSRTPHPRVERDARQGRLGRARVGARERRGRPRAEPSHRAQYRGVGDGRDAGAALAHDARRARDRGRRRRTRPKHVRCTLRLRTARLRRTVDGNAGDRHAALRHHA